MKYLSIIIILLLNSPFFVLAEANEKPKVDLLGITLEEKFYERSDLHELREFTPINETLERWTTLYGSRLIKISNLSAYESAQNTVKNINNNVKPKNPMANARMFELQEKGTFLIEFLMPDPGHKFYEFNFFIHKDTKKGVKSVQLAKRIYLDEEKELIELFNDLETNRFKYINFLKERIGQDY